MHTNKLAIVGATIHLGTGKVIDNGTVLVKDAKIEEVSENIITPVGYEVVEAVGKTIIPGLIDAHCHVGIYEEVYRFEGDDLNEGTEAATPHLRAIDGINPEDEGFKDALAGGVTTVMTGPGSANVIGGEAVVLKTYGTVVDEMVVKNPAGLKVAFGENPKHYHGNQKRMPSTRMGTAAILREQLVKAQNYLRKQEATDTFVERDLRLEALAKVLQREIPLRAHAHRADDIVTAIRVAEEFGVDLVIEHCTEGHKLVDYLVQKQVAAVVGPIVANRSKVELKDRSNETAKTLIEAGMQVAIMTDHPVVPLNYLALSAGLVVKTGLDKEKTLQAITLMPAQILGIDDRLGSIEPGKDADLVILSGDLFELQTKVEQVYVEGTLVFRA